MIFIEKVTVHCNWPGCRLAIETLNPFGYYGNYSFIKKLEEELEDEKGWIINLTSPVESYESFCPVHGRCQYCGVRKARSELRTEKDITLCKDGC